MEELNRKNDVEKDWLEIARTNPAEFEEYFADQIAFFDFPIGEKEGKKIVDTLSIKKPLQKEEPVLKKPKQQQNVSSTWDTYIWIGTRLAEYYFSVGKREDCIRILKKLKKMPSGREKVLQILRSH
jgi:hypothetical protein